MLVPVQQLVTKRAAAAVSVTDLGTLGGLNSDATALNDNGQVVGEAQNAAGSYHAFSWTPGGGMVDIGTLSGLGGDSNAVGVDANGEVAGNASTPDGSVSHAFFWTSGSGIHDLGTFGGPSSLAIAISEAGQVVGWAATASGYDHAFSWTEAGGLVDLGALGGAGSNAMAVNGSGEVVGDWLPFLPGGGSGPARAFSWTATGGMVDLGNLGGGANVTGVNDSGQVVGQSGTTGNTAVHAFSWTPAGGMTDIGTLGGTDSTVTDINDSGLVTGWAYLPGDATYHAFAWSAAGGMVDLGTLGGSYSQAVAVNSNGAVVGYSTLAGDTSTHAFSWTPTGGMVDLGTLGGTTSLAKGINGSGLVAGYSSLGGDTTTHAATWKIQTTSPPDVGPVTVPGGPEAVNTAVSASAPFTDSGNTTPLQAVWSWGDGATSTGTLSGGTTSGTALGNHTYTAPGVYTVSVTVTNGVGQSGSATATTFVVVYNPTGGFVTGGGWINSPPGAYTANTALTGTAHFGFVSKYQKGATVPTGNTEFQFQTTGLDFKSDAYQWLVISGAKAQYKGTGSINGASGYGFLLTACDVTVTGNCGGNSTDTFRIKIWETSTNTTVYDNAPGPDDLTSNTEAIGGGNIIIHKS
jgi:probable HAF family extracellular repeat protein